ncbi:AmmeMemoRadiSam system protein A [Carboxydothermus hydrogenoformans]|uniref:3,4-dihydroxyphenylacetate 2,3-dioxygenase, homolog/AMMECR1 domain protein n=1 Tax=Carboxydothermus hydrogenoformans (strain ATCC BAA-161 / DSM 6008 / Z-2901) TaxID=246194 RepID=Q3A9V7_CARHZ|nr:AmmeMemoRadiSam system protein A [Carboxydothermus hydrogenoformans]ABB14018.1 3,4-dihydroxyphenylacetate 2,3-dioxygenase, homolog/AMMECR1 domain protein [Carboxydothermus hydrogenoformans Z-2901]
MGNLYGIAVPHPPIILPEIGRGEEKKCQNTINALKELKEKIKKINPETLIVISPHAPLFSDVVAVNINEKLNGNFGSFGAPHITFSYQNDLELVQALLTAAKQEGLAVAGIDESLARAVRVPAFLDHGTMVPLYYLDPEQKYKLVVISQGLIPFSEIYRLGTIIREVAAELKRKIVIIASGDLSHRLTLDAPAGYDPSGRYFDRLMVDIFTHGDPWELLTIDKSFAEQAGECGLRSFIMLFGAFEGYQVRSRVLSYEGPFGVGYMVAEVEARGEDKERYFYPKLIAKKQEEIKKRREKESPYVRLAREALETYVRTGKTITPPDPLPEIFKRKAGVFVSIKKDGELRGCIGTIAPATENLAEEIIRNSLEAGLHDPRFEPVEEHELDELTYSVDILYPPEEVRDLSELDPKKYGVIVSKGFRRGLLLPNLEGVDTVEKQLAIAKRKAGIAPDEPVKIERFLVERYF